MNIYQKLYRAIKNHSELEDYSIIEAGQHGADAGWNGFIYTKECIEFYEQNESDIWELLREESESMGYKNPQEMISGFRRQDMLDDPDQFKNLLAWFALEEIGRWLEDDPSEGDDYE
jgi:hypothetical protein